ncbi:ABC transporter substrate-binding protein [Paenibacillus sepulcri]|uniref:ABC transporter substrate-binding protein n=1 Tax=Paenibacillus sepulcri TaxID=359917 RepID=A0ABS7C4L9_9BACL|nr:ABC transporter substrate-binding protein [Paenibacillus sepulcri]
MVKRYSTKSMAFVVAAILVLTLVLSGCGGSNTPNNSEAASGGDGGNTPAAAAEKSKVTLWYLWGGAEGEVLEGLIKKFNESQDKYVVEGLSVPDEQKVKIAIAGGNGPDLTDSFASNVAQYAEEGIALELDSLIERDKYELTDFIPASLEQGKYNGKFYALPMNTTVQGLFYNKKLLAEAGYTEPPKTSKELYDMAVKMTKKNANGTLDVLGFPSYPNFSFQALAYGFGGEYVSKDGEQVLFNSDANLAALQSIYDYNKEFGVDSIKRIQASGKWLDPTDPFMTGKQAFRIDGPWLSTFMKNNNITLDYGLAPLPYLDGHPELAGSGENQSSIFYIAKNSKNTDGAWEFMKFLFSAPELAEFTAGLGNIPANVKAMEDHRFKEIQDADAFIALSKSGNVKSLPNIPALNDILNKVVKEEAEAVANLKKTPEEGLASMQSRTEALIK